MNGTTIVFDLDGTLVDTAPDLIGATNHVLSLVGKPPVDDAFARPWISFGAMRMILESLHKAGLTPTDGELDDLHASFIAHYDANIAQHSRPFPGALDLLDRLAANGATVAICTNKRERLTLKLLGALDLTDRFKSIVGRDTLTVHKPHPDHLIETIRRAGGSRDEAVMIGDSRTDVDTARNAGVKVLGVTFGYTDIPMPDLSPDHVINHYDEAYEALTKLLNCN